ncbi:MAG TPA: chromosome segregation protein SMC [Clostridiales bacterium]|nr:chromosome segregation protein SMC [Clostridiales bacterium]
MYLKNIEIHGFKSFANKIVLDFNSGITGIVGPNGSGKSNIADAVRWVLGEQSAKQLRGYKMEDVIFSGTETRKPQGYAYVAITLDNSDSFLPIDYHQVIVARRVYRSGESEYLINGSVCRLKDVQELFMDTGIGKEGYSIIGQGQIDKILSGKPEDRREMFDEAAGIVKFKRRKFAAEKSLEQEKQNLYRVTDIINEIENQLTTLEKQSDKAKIYLKDKEEQKDLEVNMFLNEYDNTNKVKLEISDKLKISTDDYNQVNLQYENTKEEYIKLENEIELINNKIEENKLLYNDYKLKKEKLDGEINLLNNQIEMIIKNEDYQHKRITSINNENEEKSLQINDFRNQIELLNKKLKEHSSKLNSTDIEATKYDENILELTNKIEEYKTNNINLIRENSNINSSLQHNLANLDQSGVRSLELNQELIKNQIDQESLKGNFKELEDEFNDSEIKIKRYNTIINKLKEEINILQTELDDLNKELDQVQHSYLVEKSKMDSLLNITERYDGYGNSIRKVMEYKNEYKGIIGAVADVIKVDKKYEIAIETALGGTIQNIITKDEETAKAMIGILKNNKFGRATFLPLTNIYQPKLLNYDMFSKEEGVISFANDLVKVDSEYNKLINYLLARILVVDNINNASRIARKNKFTLKIVTLDGELLNPGGSISGGSYRNSSNLLGRRRELEDLQVLVNKLEGQVKKLIDKRKIANDNILNLKSNLEKETISIQKQYIEHNTIKMNLETITFKLEDNNKSFNNIKLALAKLDESSIDYDNEIKKLNVLIENNNNKSKEIELEIEKLNLLLNEKKNKKNTYEKETSSLNMEISSVKQNIFFINENILRLNNETDKLNDDKNKILFEIDQANNDIMKMNNDINSKKNELKEYEVNIKDTENNILNITNNKENVLTVHKNFFTKREELFERINLLDKDIFRLKTQNEKYNEQINNLIDYMWDEYEITYNAALMYKKELNLNPNQIKKRINEIKNHIRTLGDINVGAIEEFKTKSERFTFLNEQKADIIKAEESLNEIIKLLETEMQKQFIEHFSNLHKQFDIVFKELFGGGKASLELSDDQDILGSGIIINAQPPGKRLQNMMQLSGGEKALTAIALLFAIQNLKPSPFCLLDEIEAALDESNVKRFAKYLNKLSNETQFIVITHRRGTMSVTDTLYGITMYEKGVSTLVSVNLIENELDK